MNVGVNFFLTAYTIDPARLAIAIEELGFDSLWVPDHLVFPAGGVTYHGTGGSAPTVYGQMAEPFLALAYAGAATAKIKLATGICVVPERNPLALAKTVSTLDRFCGGRVILGVGAGWLADEIELFGVPFADRWPYLEESVRAMKLLWENGRARFDGEHVRFPEVLCDPMPVTRPHPPVILGGPPTPATFRRVACWADGWLPVFVTAEEVAAGRLAIAHECEEIGRDPSEVGDQRLGHGRLAPNAGGLRRRRRFPLDHSALQPSRNSVRVPRMEGSPHPRRIGATAHAGRYTPRPRANRCCRPNHVAAKPQLAEDTVDVVSRALSDGTTDLVRGTSTRQRRSKPRLLLGPPSAGGRWKPRNRNPAGCSHRADWTSCVVRSEPRG